MAKEPPNRIAELRVARGLSQEDLAREVGTSNQQISKLERGQGRLTVEWMLRLAPVLGVEPAELMTARGGAGLRVSGRNVVAGGLFSSVAPTMPTIEGCPVCGVLEVDARAGAGFGGEAVAEAFSPTGAPAQRDAIIAEWGIPPDYLWSELRARPGDLRMLQIDGDSMEPTLKSGDKAIVNLKQRTPSPGGPFVLFDGLAVVAKRLDYIPNSDPPTVAIVSDNPKHKTYERTLEETHIIGRIVWIMRRL